MARPNVELHPDATAEARAAFLWYDERNPSAANAFIAELDRRRARDSQLGPDPLFARLNRSSLKSENN